MCSLTDIPTDVLIKIGLLLPTKNLILFTANKYLSQLFDTEELWRQKLEEYGIIDNNNRLWKNAYIEHKPKWHIFSNHLCVELNNIVDKNAFLEYFDGHRFLIICSQLYAINGKRELVHIKFFENMKVTQFDSEDNLFVIIADNQLYTMHNEANIELMTFFENKCVTHVACGKGHMAIIANNKLYTHGLNDSYQLGANSQNNYCNVPQQITDIGDVDGVACANLSTFVISNHKLYSCGYNSDYNTLLFEGDTCIKNFTLTQFDNITYFHVIRHHGTRIFISNNTLYVCTFAPFKHITIDIEKIFGIKYINNFKVMRHTEYIYFLINNSLYELDIYHTIWSDDIKKNSIPSWRKMDEYLYVENINNLGIYGIKN